MNAAPEPSESALGTSDIKDPATDLTASYALEPSYVRPLLARVLASSGETVPTYCPFNGQPLAMIPQSTPQDVDEAFRRARRAQEQWARYLFNQAFRFFRLGYASALAWTALAEDRTALENQWYCVMQDPEPIAFVGFETSPGELYSRGDAGDDLGHQGPRAVQGHGVSAGGSRGHAA